ncbi:uncharacterized protein LOC143180576 [Calliopsis andreniformis]|uniref:uncharacterized protein LOC143180576 n=1 Tax=Calliopsis andreniformis TaxID=337506 RepID=UPI003FCCA6C5
MSVKQNGIKNEEKEKQITKKVGNAQNSSDNFDPPDGGWGWIIVIAAGLSNFCIFPILQSFGLIFKDRFAELGINSSQTTTVININSAVTSCIGLANGPLFKKFSFRQIAFVGALICAISITMSSTTKTLTTTIIFFSILYGIGIGITMSSNSLALNTYFKKNRRRATAFSWTCTGMGPIILPHVITFLMPIYGVEGTVLIFGAFAFNAVACALLLQPVSQHLKKKEDTIVVNGAPDAGFEKLSTQKMLTEKSDKIQKSTFQSKSLENIDENIQNSNTTLNLMREKFGSQYLYYDDEEDGASGIDVLGPTSLMMSRANDGWFSRKDTSSLSLASKTSRRESLPKVSNRTPSLSRQSSLTSRGPSIRNLSRQYSETESIRRKISSYQTPNFPLIIVNESCEHNEDCEQCTEPDCNKKSRDEVETDQLMKQEDTTGETTKKSIFEAVVIFFDLDLLRDAVYVNLMLGITFAQFAELNFSLMTPFILSEYGFSKFQVATVMSILAGVDVATRLLIPFIADFIGWDNRTFFLVGIGGLACGRVVLAHVGDFEIALAIAVLLGLGKGLRTIFMALVIPSHVPLSRLPAATGLQLLTSGLVSLILGPIVGWIRDFTSNYMLMLHFLNIFTLLIIISWSLEVYFTKRKARKVAKKETTSKQINV